MKKTLQLGLLCIGTLALSLTLVSAEGKCGNSQQGMMEGNGKCSNSQKGMQYTEEKRETYQHTKEKRETSQKGMMDKEGASMKPKPAPTKGKCGQGKCGE